MKVIVTGNLGFLGHHVTHEIVERGHQVVGIDRVDGAVSDKAERIELQRGWDVAQENFDMAAIRPLFRAIETAKPDAIIHCAAQYSVQYTTDACVRYVRNNLGAFTYLFEAAKVYEIPRVVYASSTAIADDGRPSGLYGATKSYGEQCAHAYCQRSKVQAVGVRLGPIYGPLSRDDTHSYRALRQYLDGEPIKDNTELSKAAPYVYVRDAARALVAAATVEVLHQKHLVVLAAGNHPFASVVDLLRAAQLLVGREPRWPARLERHGYARSHRVPDLLALRLATGYVPDTSLEDGVAAMVAWMRP